MYKTAEERLNWLLTLLFYFLFFLLAVHVLRFFICLLNFVMVGLTEYRRLNDIKKKPLNLSFFFEFNQQTLFFFTKKSFNFSNWAKKYPWNQFELKVNYGYLYVIWCVIIVDVSYHVTLKFINYLYFLIL